MLERARPRTGTADTDLYILLEEAMGYVRGRSFQSTYVLAT